MKLDKGPFAGMEVTIAAQDGVEQFDALADEFLAAILDVHGALITDLSDLSDFTITKEDDEEAYAKIEEKYGVNVRGKNNLLEIFRIIHATNRTPQ